MPMRAVCPHMAEVHRLQETPPPYVVPTACGQACLNSTVGICPLALVVKMGGLTPGAAQNAAAAQMLAGAGQSAD